MVQRGPAVLNPGVGLDQTAQIRPLGERGGEIGIALVAVDEHRRRVESAGIEQRPLIRNLGAGHTAEQMGAHVLRLRRRGVVRVAADVEVVVVRPRSRRVATTARIAGDGLEALIGARRSSRRARGADSSGRDPPRSQRSALMNSTLPRRSDGLGLAMLAQDQDAGRNAGAIEEVRPQTDDGLDQILIEEALADLAPPVRPGTARRAERPRPAGRADAARRACAG
ncbi:MAG: hypothetical protein MZU95_12165 [Desulfomicrobium escambiense]|nr:hypothetical protein [Desulfomicrobium escambiense]